MSAGYQDEDDAITGINVTPFVDVVLVLLLIFMVTAKLIVARGVHIDKPQGQGTPTTAQLRLSVAASGEISLNGQAWPSDEATIDALRQALQASGGSRVLIAGDKASAYDRVMHAIGLSQKAGATGITLENVPVP